VLYKPTGVPLRWYFGIVQNLLEDGKATVMLVETIAHHESREGIDYSGSGPGYYHTVWFIRRQPKWFEHTSEVCVVRTHPNNLFKDGKSYEDGYTVNPHDQ
jgi:hypothetical protein